MSRPNPTTYTRRFQILAAVAAGLYPIIHYYNGNLEMADSWIQLLFLLGVGITLPTLLMLLSRPIFRIKPLQKLAKYRVAAINLSFFFGLLSMLIFLTNRKIIVLVFLGAVLLSFILYKYLKKIVIIQYILAFLSILTFVPKAGFALKHTNDWALPADDIVSTSFKKYPNIYVIQPDGYTSFSTLKKAPYNYLDTTFEEWLAGKSFVNYDDFRSNYYSTLTSNSSLFAMRHHYYGNTYKGNLKTFNSQEIIAGNNMTIATLKNNNYKTHFLTDNSYILINRKMSHYDYCNIPNSKLSFYKPGRVRGVDIITDFEEVMQETSSSHNFFFIEKTIPGHIAHGKSASMGVDKEQERYLTRVEIAQDWMVDLIDIITKNDDNPMIIILSDHGGYVGLNYVKEVLQKELSPVEINSVFSSLLSIKWPSNEVPEDLEFKSSVNLFRTIFSYLSEDSSLLVNGEKDKSYLPYNDGSGISFYEYIDANGNVVFNNL
ncbi:MAG: hypothetical protein O6943_09525 [Bacteroidetes bacterium]|nr:hypothetical protein [Bacteroidota bacterium]